MSLKLSFKCFKHVYRLHKHKHNIDSNKDTCVAMVFLYECGILLCAIVYVLYSLSLSAPVYLISGYPAGSPDP